MKKSKTADTAVNDNETVIRLHAEDLDVSKQKVVTGQVRISKVTHESEAIVDEDLADERVEITREPVGKQIEAMPQVRTEGDVTIIPVVEEVVVVERRLLLKEEIRVRRVRETRRFQESVKVKRQEAVVTRNPSTDTNS
jgi:uncharacterized protein (TIGR02271 family)